MEIVLKEEGLIRNFFPLLDQLDHVDLKEVDPIMNIRMMILVLDQARYTAIITI
jgi:hypothetical protein